MTSWEPYPSAAHPDRASTSPSASTTTYEPYPAYSQDRTDDGYRPAQQVVPYRPEDTGRPSVSPRDSVKLAAKNWNNFSGRASRSEFWWPALLMLIVNATVGNAAEASFRAASASGISVPTIGFAVLGAVLFAVWIAFVVPMISLGVRRLHDTGRSGWLALTALIPMVGPFIAALLLSKPSDPSGETFDDPRSMPFGPEDLRPR